MNAAPLMPLQLEQLRSLSTCVVASAIETFGVRLRNKGFSRCPVALRVPGAANCGGIRSHGPHTQFRSPHGRA